MLKGVAARQSSVWHQYKCSDSRLKSGVKPQMRAVARALKEQKNTYSTVFNSQN